MEEKNRVAAFVCDCSTFASMISCAMGVIYWNCVPSFSIDAALIFGPLQVLSAIGGMVLLAVGAWGAPRETRNTAGWLLLAAGFGIWLNFFMPVEVVPTLR